MTEKYVVCTTCGIRNHLSDPNGIMYFVSHITCWRCKETFPLPKSVSRTFRANAARVSMSRNPLCKMVADLKANKKPFLTAADLVFLRELKVGL